MTLTEKLEHLERLCAELERDGWYDADDLVGPLRNNFGPNRGNGVQAALDAAFIASAHPSLVEALIGVAREAQQAADELGVWSPYDESLKNLRRSLESLDAALSNLEAVLK